MKKGIDWTNDAHLLGTASDKQIAELLGRTKAQVTFARKVRGIPPYYEPTNPGIVWDEQHIALLGTMPDIKLAIRLGVSHATIRLKRKGLGIKPYDDAPKLGIIRL